MENISIIFFGKPDGFESYEFKPNGVKNEVSHFEPNLKLESRHKDVFHSFTRNGYSYIELYGFAKAYDTGRDGVVIGVAVKSDRQLEISKNNYAILTELLNHFKNEALDGKMFKTTKILSIVSKIGIDDTLFGDFDIMKTRKTTKGILPLFLEDYQTKLEYISEFHKKYSDIYVSQDKDIFEAKVNIRFLYTVENKFFTIINSKLIEFKEPIKTNNQQISTLTQTDDEIVNLKSDFLNEKSRYVGLEKKFENFRRVSRKMIIGLAVTSLVLFLSLCVIFLKDFNWFNKSNSKPSYKTTSQTEEMGQSKKNEPKNGNGFININYILENHDNRTLIKNILLNIEKFEKTKKMEYSNAIIRDCKTLNIDHPLFQNPSSSPSSESSMTIVPGMTVFTLIQIFENKYSIDEIEKCNKNGIKKDSNGNFYLIADVKITMPCK
ncbi:MAG TPA: hypothetical protein VK169_08770 [Saprospiraceae bacterium]|nr:hypothetical protein [Saprospiraceae bacterium]